MDCTEHRALQRLEPRKLQKCPLCGESQTIMIRGSTIDLEDGESNVVGDRGYSFCNCRNIFFTKWSNIDQSIYDTSYIDRYTEKDGIEVRMVAERMWKEVQKACPHACTFLELGALTEIVPDFIKEKTFSNITFTQMDLIPRESKYNLIVADFESYEPQEKFDVIWATHFFEHLKDPIKAILKIKDILNPGGVVYFSMPDTHFINWHDPLNWAWNVQEHHTLWNIYDFISFVESYGLKNVYKKLTNDTFQPKGEALRWIMESRTIFKKPE